MKRQNPLIIPATILLLGIALNSFAGSVILTHARIESLLSDAGFQIHTGPDAQQQLRYLQTTPYTVERQVGNGQVVYTYADPQAGFLYTGGQVEYQQYKRVLREASISEERWQTSEALAKPWQDWDWTWRPWKLLRWGYENFPND